MLSYKDFTKNLESVLKRNNLFFFYGGNNYYMLEILDLISKKFNVLKETVYLWEAEIEDLSKKLTTLSLFSQKTMVVFRYFNLAEKKTFKKDLIDFLQKYKFDNYLFILYEEELSTKEKNDEIIKALLNICVCVEFKSLTKEELIDQFIDKKVDLNLTQQAKEVLCEYTNNDLWLISNELEKLKYCFDKNKEISEEDIYKYCSIYELAEIKQLIDSIEKKDLKEVLETLNVLLTQEVLPIQIFVAIYRYFRKKFLYQRMEDTKIYKILKEMQTTDLRLKTTANSKYVLENFVLSLMQIY
jgi:DNA polymerase III delta subunit